MTDAVQIAGLPSRGKTTRQSFNLSSTETATSLRVLVDKVVLEIFAGGGRSVATVAVDKRGVDPSSAVISVAVEQVIQFVGLIRYVWCAVRYLWGAVKKTDLVIVSLQSSSCHCRRHRRIAIVVVPYLGNAIVSLT